MQSPRDHPCSPSRTTDHGRYRPPWFTTSTRALRVAPPGASAGQDQHAQTAEPARGRVNRAHAHPDDHGVVRWPPTARGIPVSWRAVRQSCPTAEELARRSLIATAFGLVDRRCARGGRADLEGDHGTGRRGRPDCRPPPLPGRGGREHRAARLPRGARGVLVLAAIAASCVGANQRCGGRSRSARARARRVRHHLVVAVRRSSAPGGPALDVQATTGLIAVAVLLVIMNWFFHSLLDRLDLRAQREARTVLERGADGRSAARCSASRCSASPLSTARASRSSSSCRTCDHRPARKRCSRASRRARR